MIKKMTQALLSILVVLGYVLSSEAAVSTKKTQKSKTQKTLQVYSAYEADDDNQDPAPVAPLSEIRVAKAPDPYFSVPSRQTDLIAARLQVVEAILIESGRAYDYRSHTMKELKNILNEIRAQKLAE